MRAKKKPAPAMKKTARQPRREKTIPISPMHSSAEEYEVDGDPVEDVQQVHSSETEPVAIPAMVIRGWTTGPTSTATTTPTASNSTDTSASASRPKTPRSSGFLFEDDEDKMIEWLQENRFIYDMESNIYKDKSSKTTAWQTQAENLGFEVRCLLTWYNSVRTRYGKLTARPSGYGAELTYREKWILNNLKFLKPYIHRVKKKTPVSLKGKITAATDATVDDASSSIADEESTQDMQQRHDEDIADINMVLDRRKNHIETQTTIPLEQMPPSSTGDKKKIHAQKMKEQDPAFLSHMKERADATAKFRVEIMATVVTPIVSSPKKLDSRSRSGFCNWFESVAESLHPIMWTSFKRKIIPIIVSFDEQNDKWQISSTLSTPTTQPQTQVNTSKSVHRQQDTFPPVSSAHMFQQANLGSMMSYSGAGGCHSTLNPANRWQFRQQYSKEQRPRSLSPEIRMQSQQFVGYGAAYHAGYSESHAGSHAGTWDTEDSRPPSLCVHHGSSSGQSRPKSVTTSTVVSGEQDASLLDITLTDTLNIPPTTSPSELVEIGAIMKSVSAD